MKRIACITGLWLAIIAGPHSVAAEEASAMVESISTMRDDVMEMDYLTAGQTIRLAANETLVVGYFLSCAQETIIGGTVMIGKHESSVEGGKIETQFVSCDDQVVQFSLNQQQAAGTSVLRPGEPCNALVPDIVIYDVSPLIRHVDLSASLDYSPACEASSGQWSSISGAGKPIDFRDLGIELEQGATYLLRQGDRTVVLLVSKLAERNASSIIARYVPFPPK